MTTLLDAFADAVDRFGSRPAIIEKSGRDISFEDLDVLSKSLAAGFASRGIGPGDRVLMAMPVGIELYASLAAVWRVGATVVFPEPAMGLKGLRHAARTTRPKAFLASGLYRILGFVIPELLRLELRVSPHGADPRLAPDIRVSPADIALISFTSGSTGAPKAIARSHAFMMAQCDAIAPMLEPRPEGERDLVAFPVFVLVCLALGITAVLPEWKLTRHDQVDAQTIHAQIKRYAITRLLVPPAICETLGDAATLPSLHAIFTGGGPVFPDTLNRLADLCRGLNLVAVYGSTEAEPIAHLDYADISADDLDRMKTGEGLLAGQPVDAVDIWIEDGEIRVAGAHVNESYLDPAQNAETKVERDGRIWHRTGDAGRLDEQGRLWLLGRTNARIGGVDPFAVETAARFWPGAERSALANVDDQPVLAVAGDSANLDQWKSAAKELGVPEVRYLKEIPLDRRHRSKTDYVALSDKLKRA